MRCLSALIRKIGFFVVVLPFLGGLAGCVGETEEVGGDRRGGSRVAMTPGGRLVSMDLCECVGTGPGQVPVTATCGELACGSDYTLYACSPSGVWTWTGQECGTDGGVEDGGVCECSGTGPGGVPVTAVCGESACGSDYTLYACSASGWTWTGQSCAPGTGGAGGSTGTTPCECFGTGPGGVPVTASCGESACGSDYVTYACDANGWTWTGQSCAPGTGGAGGAGGTGGSTGTSPCECHGTGPGSVPVTASCGESACGSDYTLYACSASGWSWTGIACGSAGCGAILPAACSSTSGPPCTIDVGGMTREYFLVPPFGYDNQTPVPVVFSWHPFGGTAAQVVSMAFYGVRPHLPNAIYVSPQGLDDSGGSSYGWPNTEGRDIAFLQAMIARIEAQYCVDSSRYFSNGFSYGAIMSDTIACEMPDVFRAIGTIAGAFLTPPSCVQHPIAAWSTHGLVDTVLPLSYGEQARDLLIAQNGCDTVNTHETTVADPAYGTVTCTVYDQCTSGNYPVVWCPVADMGHQIPAFAAAEMASFFAQF